MVAPNLVYSVNHFVISSHSYSYQYKALVLYSGLFLIVEVMNRCSSEVVMEAKRALIPRQTC